MLASEATKQRHKTTENPPPKKETCVDQEEHMSEPDSNDEQSIQEYNNEDDSIEEDNNEEPDDEGDDNEVAVTVMPVHNREGHELLFVTIR